MGGVGICESAAGVSISSNARTERLRSIELGDDITAPADVKFEVAGIVTASLPPKPALVLLQPNYGFAARPAVFMLLIKSPLSRLPPASAWA
jgi:hypothetical protein